MTEKEAQDLLLGPTKRDLVKRQLERILRAVDNDDFIDADFSVYLSSVNDYVRRPKWKMITFKYTIREEIK